MVAKYSTWTRGQDEALLNKLGGMEVALRLLACNEVTVIFDAETKRATVTAVEPELKVWKTIKIGTGIKDGKSFCFELEKNNFWIGECARRILEHESFTVATEETDINLFVMSVADLGFRISAHYNEICTAALEKGFKLCPAEVGPQLRLQYLDQPIGEHLGIAMEAIRDSYWSPLCIFSVGRNEFERVLSGNYCDPGVSGVDDLFVFRAPASAKATAGRRKQPSVV